MKGKIAIFIAGSCCGEAIIEIALRDYLIGAVGVVIAIGCLIISRLDLE